jgi:hypothetical protein
MHFVGELFDTLFQEHRTDTFTPVVGLDIDGSNFCLVITDESFRLRLTPPEICEPSYDLFVINRYKNPDVEHSDEYSRTQTWLRPNQVEQLRDVCLSDAVAPYLQDRNEVIVALLYDAGLRAGELCALD